MKILFIVLVLVSHSAFSGETKGKIKNIWVHVYNDYVLFSLDSNQMNFSACAVTQRYVVSTSTQQGKNVLSVILAAKAAGQSIIVNGKNTCTIHGDAEDISALVVE